MLPTSMGRPRFAHSILAVLAIIALLAHPLGGVYAASAPEARSAAPHPLLHPDAFAGAVTAPTATTYYVDADATGAATGLSRTDAFTNLQVALAAVVAGDEIWVAAGVYKPTSGTDRTIRFTLKNGVGLYGGFAGTETARDRRDWRRHVTTLSGDIGVIGDNSDNTRTVISTASTDATTMFDGFTVTGGNASAAWESGGGMVVNSASPTIANVIFENNTTWGVGGGLLANNGSNPTLTNVAFIDNIAGTGLNGDHYACGGGMGVWNGSSPTLINVLFRGNSASYCGGGLFVDAGGNPDLVNVSFTGNRGGVYGDGMVNGSNSRLVNVTFTGNQAIGLGGGLMSCTGTLSLINTLFSGNLSSNGGGGMYNSGRPDLVNVTFTGNRANVGGGVYNEYDRADLTNAILWGNAALTGTQLYNSNATLNFSYSLVQSDTNVWPMKPASPTSGGTPGWPTQRISPNRCTRAIFSATITTPLCCPSRPEGERFTCRSWGWGGWWNSPRTSRPPLTHFCCTR